MKVEKHSSNLMTFLKDS